MAQKRKPDQTKLIVEAALELAAKSGFSALTMEAIAKKAQVKPAAVTSVFSDKWAILRWLVHDIETRTVKDVKDHLGDNWRDNLFEIMMTRIEFAAPHKKALATLPRAFANEAKVLPGFGRIFARTIAGILKLAGAPKAPHHIAAFGVLYISVAGVFLKDDTHDHAKTMAALDKRLGLFEQFVEFSACRKAA